MNAAIDYQIIQDQGQAKFAVVPIEQFRDLMRRAGTEPSIPHAVMRALASDEVSPVRAWREHLGLTQAELAQRLGISQSAMAQKENPSAKLRPKTLEAIANAMGIMREQLDL